LSNDKNDIDLISFTDDASPELSNDLERTKKDDEQSKTDKDYNSEDSADGHNKQSLINRAIVRMS